MEVWRSKGRRTTQRRRLKPTVEQVSLNIDALPSGHSESEAAACGWEQVYAGGNQQLKLRPLAEPNMMKTEEEEEEKQHLCSTELHGAAFS